MRAAQPWIFWLNAEGHGRLRNLVQLLLELESLFDGKARARAAAVDQFSFLMNSQDQRAKPRKVVLRRRITGNHKLLPLNTFSFQPVSIAR